ncbi:MAG: hypothetical protein U0893_14500 [Chloroflexota bacterium]
MSQPGRTTRTDTPVRAIDLTIWAVVSLVQTTKAAARTATCSTSRATYRGYGGALGTAQVVHQQRQRRSPSAAPARPLSAAAASARVGQLVHHHRAPPLSSKRMS